MPLSILSIRLARTKLSFLLVALVAFAVIAAACSSSDDEPAVDSSDDQAATTAETQTPAEADPEAQAQANDDEEAPGQSAPEASGDNGDDSDASEAESNEADSSEGGASDGATSDSDGASAGDDDAGDGDAADDDGGMSGGDDDSDGDDSSGDDGLGDDDGSEATTSTVSTLALGDLAAIEDLRFDGVIVLDILPNTPDGDLDLTAFGDIAIEGGFVAPADFEVAIRLGDGSAGFGPIGIVSLGDTLYTNLGFGWDAQEGGAGGLLDSFGGLVDPSALGIDPDAIDVEGVEEGGLEGLGDLVPEDFNFDEWDDDGTENLEFGPAQRYSITSDSLEDFVQRLLGDTLETLTEAADADEDALLDLSAVEDLDAEVEQAQIVVWIDEATGTLAAASLEIRDLVITDFDGDGNGLTIASVTMQIDVNPEFGLPTVILLEAEDLVIEGPDGAAGNLRLEFRTFDVNAGTAVIEAPI